jgi:hypothetical protein
MYTGVGSHPRTAEVTVIQLSCDEVIVTVPDGRLMGNDRAHCNASRLGRVTRPANP